MISDEIFDELGVTIPEEALRRFFLERTQPAPERLDLIERFLVKKECLADGELDDLPDHGVPARALARHLQPAIAETLQVYEGRYRGVIDLETGPELLELAFACREDNFLDASLRRGRSKPGVTRDVLLATEHIEILPLVTDLVALDGFAVLTLQPTLQIVLVEPGLGLHCLGWAVQEVRSVGSNQHQLRVVLYDELVEAHSPSPVTWQQNASGVLMTRVSENGQS